MSASAVPQPTDPKVISSLIVGVIGLGRPAPRTFPQDLPWPLVRDLADAGLEILFAPLLLSCFHIGLSMHRFSDDVWGYLGAGGVAIIARNIIATKLPGTPPAAVRGFTFGQF
jgi:hypothetical protein